MHASRLSGIRLWANQGADAATAWSWTLSMILAAYRVIKGILEDTRGPWPTRA